MKLRTLMIMLLGILLVATPVSAASTPRSQGRQSVVAMQQAPVFQVVSVHSGKCLDVHMASKDDGAKVQQWTCYGPQSTNQLWRFVWVGNGYQIVSVHSGKCLDVTMVSPDDGALAQQWTCLGTQQTNQIWRHHWNGDLNQLVATHSNKCLEVAGFGTADGVSAQQWSCGGWGANSQLWYLRQVSTTSTYYLRLTSISNVRGDDDLGADEPRLYVNDQLVWALDGWRQGEITSLNVEYPFAGDSLPIVIQEYDGWPSSTITLNPSPFTVARAQVGSSTKIFWRDGVEYQLTYEVVLR